MTPTRTTCPYCGVGCGVLATPDGRGRAEIAGDKTHPANYGRLCSKGSALGETISLEGRLLVPKIGGENSDWDKATALIAERFRTAIDEHGPDSVAFYVSGQLLTEDYYVANKLMKGYIGAANIDTNSRLCMASSVAGHKRAFGADTVPGTYEDLEQADLIVLTGSNLAWCHPVLYQRIAAAKETRPGLRVVNIDPRVTATCELADLHLPLALGSDVALFNGLLLHLAEMGAVDQEYTHSHVTGLEASIDAASADATHVAEITGLEPGLIAQFYALFTRTEKVVTVYSQGVNQSSSGSDKVNAILNCHLASGRIGRPGMGPFSVTGQPNAMGGREVGGLANMLACHLDIENPQHRAAVQGFWRSPKICERPGLKAVDLFRACADGRVKALWIMSTNPAVSMPEADAVRDAISACPFVVVSDILEDTDTARLADVLLPATGWGEKSGTVTNSDRTISRQRPFLPVPGEARPDWRAVSDVAAAMGWADDFAYRNPAEIFREHARLSGIAGKMGRDFDISGLAEISDQAFEDLAPTRWPVTGATQGGRFFADGGFFTPDAKARALPVKHRGLAAPLTDRYPLRLNTGRVRDHWHTMTRTARAPRLSKHIAEPYAEIHPTDAAARGISPADLLRVESAHGRATLRALITHRTPEGTIFVPMHWTAVWSSQGRIDAAIAAATDPVSGQPELKGMAVEVTRLAPDWYAFAACRADWSPYALPGLAYWAKARAAPGIRVELAGFGQLDAAALAQHMAWDVAESDILEITDQRAGMTRLGISSAGQPQAVLFAGPDPVEIARDFVLDAFDKGMPMASLLAGRPAADQPDPGATVCSCFDIGANTILRVVQDEGLTTLDQIGARLRAGGNCGSCRPEIRRLIAEAQPRLAAE